MVLVNEVTLRDFSRAVRRCLGTPITPEMQEAIKFFWEVGRTPQEAANRLQEQAADSIIPRAS